LQHYPAQTAAFARRLGSPREAAHTSAPQ
jgi:hypothetical protein